MKLYFTFLMLMLMLVSCSEKSKLDEIYTPPALSKSEVVESYFEKRITDPYRNIEDKKDSTVYKWYKDQDNYAEGFLSKINNRDLLVKSLYEIDNRKSYKISKIKVTKNDTWFYLKKNLDETYYKLYYKVGEKGRESLLFDPRFFKSNTENEYVINYINPSWDSKHIVVSLSHSGRELSEMIIIDMDTKRPLPEIIENAWPSNFLGISWLPDNTGFTFLYFPSANSTDSEFKQNSQSVLYMLNDNPKDLKYIFGNKTHPEYSIKDNEYPIPVIKSDTDNYIISYIAGVDTNWNAYYARIEDIKSGNLNWKLLHSKDEKIIHNKGAFKNNNFIYLSSKNNDNRQILSVSIDSLNFDSPILVSKEKDNEIINDFELTKDALFYTTTRYGVDASLYKVIGFTEVKLETPKKAGEISLYSKSMQSNDLWISTSGWINSSARYKYDNKANNFIEDYLSPKIEYPEFKNLIAEEVLVTAHDGEKIPFSIIYDKSIKNNSENPVFLYSYGAYGDIESPYFSPLMLDFVAKGGVFGVAHVRGGGEKGEYWHKNGFKQTKPNSWKDLISCAEYLIDEKYTSKMHTAIYGGSAGGLNVGRAITERPDLFAVAISEAGLLNPLRMETGAGGSNYKEFGTVKDSIECMSLIKMDPYLHIKDSVDYPATYLTIGVNDPLVNPWMTGKFTARLQNANKLKRPILLNVDYNSGHGGSDNALKVYEEWANIFSFIYWQTGHPDYQIID